jgi:hypothetical protein
MAARSWKLFDTGLARLPCVKETLAQQTQMVKADASLNRCMEDSVNFALTTLQHRLAPVLISSRDNLKVTAIRKTHRTGSSLIN